MRSEELGVRNETARIEKFGLFLSVVCRLLRLFLWEHYNFYYVALFYEGFESFLD